MFLIYWSMDQLIDCLIAWLIYLFIYLIFIYLFIYWFCDWLIAEEKKLDILINNAGANYIPERKTVDGFESIFATNHLGMRIYMVDHKKLDLFERS